MTDSIERYFQDLQGVVSDWEGNFTLPYARAYNNACNAYRETIGRQAASDKTRAELFVLAASIATGSVLMAAFATTSLRTVAANALLNFICNRNLERTFNAYSLLSNSKVAGFVLGALADKANSAIGEVAKKAASDMVAHQAPMERRDGLEFDLVMREFLAKNKSCAIKVAQAIRDNASLNGSQKAELIEELRRSPFHRPPRQSVITVARLAQRIELSFYLTDLLDADYTRSVSQSSSQFGPVTGRGQRRPIDIMPTADDYPVSYTRTTPPLHNVSIGIEVGVRTPGSDIREQTDLLHKAVFDQNFYPQQNFFERQVYDAGRGELIKAEKQLDALADQLRPLPARPFAVA